MAATAAAGETMARNVGSSRLGRLTRPFSGRTRGSRKGSRCPDAALAEAALDRMRHWRGVGGAGVGRRPDRVLQDRRAQDLRLPRPHDGGPGVGAARHRARQHRRQQHPPPRAAGGPLAVAARRPLVPDRLPRPRPGEGHRLRRALHRTPAGDVQGRRRHLERRRVGPRAGVVGGARGQRRVRGRRDRRRTGPTRQSRGRAASRGPAVPGRPGVRGAARRHPAVRRTDRRRGGRGPQLQHLRCRRAGAAHGAVRARRRRRGSVAGRRRGDAGGAREAGGDPARERRAQSGARAGAARAREHSELLRARDARRADADSLHRPGAERRQADLPGLQLLRPVLFGAADPRRREADGGPGGVPRQDRGHRHDRRRPRATSTPCPSPRGRCPACRCTRTSSTTCCRSGSCGRSARAGTCWCSPGARSPSASQAPRSRCGRRPASRPSSSWRSRGRRCCSSDKARGWRWRHPCWRWRSPCSGARPTSTSSKAGRSAR